MSNSASKNRHRRIGRRLGRKKFRADEKRILRGDRARGSYFSDRYAHMGTLREKFLP